MNKKSREFGKKLQMGNKEIESPRPNDTTCIFIFI